MDDDSLVVQVEDDGQGRIVRLIGEIDLVTVNRMPQCLLDPDVPVVTVDLSGVTFMDSAGVNMLVCVQNRARDRGGKLVLFGVQPRQMRVLGILGMVDYFDTVIPDL